MKRKDLLILLCVLALGAALYIGGRVGAVTAGGGAYMRIETPDGEPRLIPLDAERDIEIAQADGRRNVVHIFPGGFRMSEASCENHDCIKQGEVTLDNRFRRALGGNVICLPNKLVLTLTSIADEPAEALELTP